MNKQKSLPLLRFIKEVLLNVIISFLKMIEKIYKYLGKTKIGGSIGVRRTSEGNNHSKGNYIIYLYNMYLVYRYTQDEIGCTNVILCYYCS